MQETPQKEHQWLQSMVGEWTFESECIMGPDQPPSKFSGAESVRSLGGLWVVCETRGEMPGGGLCNNIITLGYDPAKKRFCGSFVSSMMTFLWIYDGSLDAAGKVLTLDALGPSFKGDGKLVQYQDLFEIVSQDHRMLRSQALGEDGKWNQFMTAHYRRTK